MIHLIYFFGIIDSYAISTVQIWMAVLIATKLAPSTSTLKKKTDERGSSY